MFFLGILSLFHNTFNISVKQEKKMLDSIYHMTQKKFFKSVVVLCEL